MSHARLSPSGFEAWSRCPGKIAAEKDLPDYSSAAAQWGTDAHALLEWMLHDWLNHDQEEQPQFEDQAEKLEVAKVAFDYVTAKYQQAEKDGLNPMLRIEDRVNPSIFTGRDDIYGTADIILETDNWTEVIDLKAGQGVLVMPDSGQLKIYGLGAVAEMVNMEEAEPIILTIAQPRIPHEDGVIRSLHTTYGELLNWNDEVLIPAAKATDDPNAPRVPGEKQCQFCKAKPTCKAVADQVLNLAMSTFQPFEPIGVATKPTIDDIVNVKPDELPMDKLVEVIEAAPLISGWLKSIEAYAKHRLENREEVPGYKLVRSGQRNKYGDNDDAILE